MAYSTEQLSGYLRRIVDLETSVYSQEKIVEQSNAELKKQLPMKGSAEVPEKTTFEKPLMPVMNGKKNILGRIIGLLFAWFIPAVLLLCIPYVDSNDAALFFMMGIVLGIPGIFIVKNIVNSIQHNSTRKQRFDEAMEQYNKELSDWEKKTDREEIFYKDWMNRYAQTTARLEAEYEIAVANYNSSCQQLQKLSVTLEETRNALKKMYDAEIVFPKYHGLIPMSTIYEYFVTGRCCELTGPNGAYNLYESELRQNLIINRLDLVVSQLEQVKNNQYLLYKGIQDANAALLGIADNICSIAKDCNDIKANSAVSAYCAQVSAGSTEALAYMYALS